MSGKGHHRRSKHYSGARSTAPVSAFPDRHPLRVSRAREAILLDALIVDVWGDWMHLAGALEEPEVDAMYQLMKRMAPRVVRRLEKMAAEYDDVPNYPGLVPTMLWAATAWICRLELPRTERDLWEGPPLVSRLRPPVTGPPPPAEAG